MQRLRKKCHLNCLHLRSQISEWYSCRWDCPAAYNCSAKLLDQNDKTIDTFQFTDTLEGEKQNQWHQVSIICGHDYITS